MTSQTPKRFLVYRERDGAILRTGTCGHLDLPLQAQAGEVSIESPLGVRDDTHYFDLEKGEVLSKLENPTVPDKISVNADGVDQIILSDLPNPSIVYAQGNAIEVTDGQLEYTTNEAGEFYFSIQSGPKYRNLEIGAVAL